MSRPLEIRCHRVGKCTVDSYSVHGLSTEQMDVIREALQYHFWNDGDVKPQNAEEQILTDLFQTWESGRVKP